MLPYTTPLTSLPAQMKTYTEKMANKKKWAKACVDALEQLGRIQYVDNLRFIENYQMLNGRFMMHHYVDDDGYRDMITQLTRDLEVPTTLRHYDIIGKLVNNLTEKLSELPDIFRVEETFEEGDTNEYTRTQTDLMHQTVQAEINQQIMLQLQQAGLDPKRTDFSSQEEAEQYKQQIQQMTQAKTPQQIDLYMKTDFQSQGEIWAKHNMKVNAKRYRTAEKFRTEFRDVLVSDRCFREFYIKGDGFDEETWNPLNTFFHKSPEVDWAEDGDYIGRIFYLTKADIINNYGWKMTAKQMEQLEKLDNEYSNDLDFNGFPYKVYAPFEDFKAYDIITKGGNYDPINKLPILGDDMLAALTTNMPYVDRNNGLFRVTQVYWKSMKKVGKVVYYDKNGLLVKELIDENFVVPDGFKQVKGEFYDGSVPNTVYWSWIPQVWKGLKICFSMQDADSIYLDLMPNEFQFKGDYNPYDCKLPVCGRIFNNRNAQSMSFVDSVKPHQVGYNLCVNTAYQIAEKNIGKFVVWDVNFFNTLKDWGGEDSFDKVQLMAKELQGVFGNTSPQNMAGANPGNQLPKVIDLDATAQFIGLLKAASFFEQACLTQVGIFPQAISDIKTTDSATGIDVANKNTAVNIGKYFTEFFQYKQRVLSMELDVSQYVQSQKKDVLINYTTSDQGRVWLQMVGTQLLSRDIGIFVVDSQKLLRQIEEVKAYLRGNNTNGLSAMDAINAISSDSLADIKAHLQVALDRQQHLEDRKFQQANDQFKAEQEQKIEIENRKDNRQLQSDETKVKIADINAGAKIASKQQLANSDNKQDNNQLDYAQFNSKVSQEAERTAVQREQNEIRREEATANKLLKSKELSIKEKAIQSKNKQIKANTRIAAKKRKVNG